MHTVQSIDAGQDNMTVDLTEATLGQDGQIIITGEDGQGNLASPNKKLMISWIALLFIFCRLSSFGQRNDNTSSFIISISINGCQYSANTYKRRWYIVYNTYAGTKKRSPMHNKHKFEYHKQ